jgi:hypothetical protein
MANAPCNGYRMYDNRRYDERLVSFFMQNLAMSITV